MFLAIESIQSSRKISLRQAAKTFNVPESSLRYRMAGCAPRNETRPNRTNLDQLEERVLSQYTLDLDQRGFAPNPKGVEDMANYMLQSRGGKHVGKTMTKSTIQDGFRDAGLFPQIPDAVIFKLETKLRIPTPTRPSSAEFDPWVSQTPNNPKEALSRTRFVKNKIAIHQGSSPIPICSAVNQMARGMEAIAHQLTLQTAELCELRRTNEALSKRRRAKKSRIRKGGVLTVEDAQDELARKDAEEQAKKDKRSEGGSGRVGPSTARRCGNCGEIGHN